MMASITLAVSADLAHAVSRHLAGPSALPELARPARGAARWMPAVCRSFRHLAPVAAALRPHAWALPTSDQLLRVHPEQNNAPRGCGVI